MRAPVVFAVVLLAATAAAADDLRWEKDWATAFERARVERKLVLVEFTRPAANSYRFLSGSSPRIRGRLERVVPLRIDTRKSDLDERLEVGGLPRVRVYDPSAYFVFEFSGYYDLRGFGAKLDELLANADTLISTGEALATAQNADTWLDRGRALLCISSFGAAADAYWNAADAAEADQNDELAQLAIADAALAEMRTGRTDQWIAWVRKVVANPVSPDAEAGLWIAIGIGESLLRNHGRARDAFARAVAVSDPDSGLHLQARTLLNATEKRRRPDA